jgi:hypothetical protein
VSIGTLFPNLRSIRYDRLRHQNQEFHACLVVRQRMSPDAAFAGLRCSRWRLSLSADTLQLRRAGTLCVGLPRLTMVESHSLPHHSIAKKDRPLRSSPGMASISTQFPPTLIRVLQQYEALLFFPSQLATETTASPLTWAGPAHRLQPCALNRADSSLISCQSRPVASARLSSM